MTLTELIQEFTDCHDKDRRNNLKAEIDKRVGDFLASCFDQRQDKHNGYEQKQRITRKPESDRIPATGMVG